MSNTKKTTREMLDITAEHTNSLTGTKFSYGRLQCRETLKKGLRLGSTAVRIYIAVSRY